MSDQRPPFPEPREIPALFGDAQFSFSGLSSGATAEVTETGYLRLRFEFDEDMIADVKLFRRAHWDPNWRCWLVTVDPEQIEMLVDFLKRGGFVFGPEVAGVLKAAWVGNRR